MGGCSTPQISYGENFHVRLSNCEIRENFLPEKFLLYVDNEIITMVTVLMFCFSVVKLWDLRRTYTNSRLEPPPAWFSFEPVTESGRQYSKSHTLSIPFP